MMVLVIIYIFIIRRILKNKYTTKETPRTGLEFFRDIELKKYLKIFKTPAWSVAFNATKSVYMKICGSKLEPLSIA